YGLPVLLGGLADRRPAARQAGAEGLARMEFPLESRDFDFRPVVAASLPALKDAEPSVRADVLAALAKLAVVDTAPAGLELGGLADDLRTCGTTRPRDWGAVSSACPGLGRRWLRRGRGRLMLTASPDARRSNISTG